MSATGSPDTRRETAAPRSPRLDRTASARGPSMHAIPAYDAMPPFLLSVVSATDLWMYVSSRGGLTAGRVEPQRAIFPYEAEDKIHTCHPFTGPHTSLRVSRGDGPTLWRPFHDAHSPDAQRTLYKNTLGTQVIFEETRGDLGLRFAYRWAPTDRFGFVRTAWLENLDPHHAADIELLDGLLNLLPAGTALATMQKASSLINAYTQAELDPETALGIVALTAKVMDTAEPGESLTANVVWSHGLADAQTALLPDAVEAFAAGQALPSVRRTRNRRPCFLAHARFTLAPGANEHWHIAADTDRTQPQVVTLRQALRDRAALDTAIKEAIDDTDRGLRAYIASADGMQHTADAAASAHHAVNVMFNGMRGGFIADGYDIDAADFLDFVATRHRPAADRAAGMLGQPLPARLSYRALRDAADATDDADLIRLTLEYLPLTFGRRHGDPSRPWNMFAINVQRPDGSRILDYQGNWRDIFQNWEALARSFPAYLEGMVAKFVNASTRDGYNPYRISRDGVDWEVPDPHDPWAHIGYWGDHQIIYLLKLLEQLHAHDPAALPRMLRRAVFSYADVPYRIKPHADLAADPRDTIDFDWDAHRATETRAATMGTDGRLVQDADGRVVHATLAEKLLVCLLAKVSNLVIGGGVWMNTQRPEWNDANNALAGSGLSVVTTGYLLRYTRFVKAVLAEAGDVPLQVRPQVAAWLREVSAVLNDVLDGDDHQTLDDAARRAALDRLGVAFERYRAAAFADDSPGDEPITPTDAAALLDATTLACRLTLHANRRDNGLYHGYNLLTLRDDPPTAAISHLPLMLEGQVAILSSGLLHPTEAAGVIESLYDSPLYRSDINTFILYPFRDLPDYLDRNRIDEAAAKANPLLAALLGSGDVSIIERDAEGTLRFSSAFVNARDLAAQLDRLATADDSVAALAREHRHPTLDLYERTFNHHAFTGRSGTMYGYEGLGCVYWHMIAKLLLAVQENCLAAAHADDRDALRRCNAAYRRVRSGLGFEQTAEGFGAFPLDPYSHTPADRGAQQPGMTGQVKEEVLTRFGELSVIVEGGVLHFEPRLAMRGEFLDQAETWAYTDGQGRDAAIELPAGSLGLTVCQTPVVLHITDDDAGRIVVTAAGGGTRTVDGLALDRPTSAALFARTGTVGRLDVHLPRTALAAD